MTGKEEKAYAILRRLRESGFIALFNGGCVRDRLLGIPVKDYDIATDARPEVVQGLFDNTVAVGAQFGVIMVVVDGDPFEVSDADTMLRHLAPQTKAPHDDTSGMRQLPLPLQLPATCAPPSTQLGVPQETVAPAKEPEAVERLCGTVRVRLTASPCTVPDSRSSA